MDEEHDDDFGDDDGWCVDCDDDYGDVLDGDDWLCRECLFTRYLKLNEEVSLLKQAAKPLAWTKERPTEPGWYWVDNSWSGVRSVMRFDGPEPTLHWSGNYRYAGPIPEPKEAS